MTRFLIALAAFVCLAPLPAAAHPHVWVSMRTELVYSPAGALTALKQAWTFDEAFSAFALQGMEKQKDGSYGDDVLKPLAEVNVTSLKEYDYFVTGKTATSKLAFADPVEYYLTYENEVLTLHFTLPLKQPLPAKGLVSLDVYDPTYFVAFSFAEKNPVTFSNLPPACAHEVVSPQPAQTMQLSEAFFSNLTSSSAYGAQFADKITVKCP